MTKKEAIKAVDAILYNNCATMSEKIEQIAELIGTTKRQIHLHTDIVCDPKLWHEPKQEYEKLKEENEKLKSIWK